MKRDEAAKKAANNLSNFLNSYSHNEDLKVFINEMAVDHRTLQQLFTKLCFNKLKKDIAEEVEIVIKEVKLLEAPKVKVLDEVIITPETKEQISKHIREARSEKEIQAEVQDIRDKMEVKKINIEGNIKDITKFEI